MSIKEVTARQESLALAEEIEVEDFLKDFKKNTTDIRKEKAAEFCRIISFSYTGTLRELIKKSNSELKKNRGIGEGMLIAFENYLILSFSMRACVYPHKKDTTIVPLASEQYQ
jgi:hypothetical protein